MNSIITWDINDQISIKELEADLTRFHSKNKKPHIYEVEDTGGSWYAILLSDKKMGRKEVQLVYDLWLDEEENEEA
jgi:hypothetical protein